jgi:1-phosphofructokinase
MIVTVTLNPSLDRTLLVPRLERGDVIRAEGTLTDPGGKGVNVARALAAHGDAVVAVLPAGGAVGRAVVALLGDTGVAVVAVAIAGTTRANVTVVEPDGTTTKLNEPGPELSDAELQLLIDAVAREAVVAEWVVVAGSLPPGLGSGVFDRLSAAAHEQNARWALDTSGEALLQALAARPDVVKPNRAELAEALGFDAASVGDVIRGSQIMRDRGADAVVCSLGADGAVLVDAGGAWHARGPRVAVRNTVGAGDALLAGFVHAGGTGPAALRTGVAWATAAIRTEGTGVPTPALVDVDDVAVESTPDPTSPLLSEVS